MFRDKRVTDPDQTTRDNYTAAGTVSFYREPPGPRDPSLPPGDVSRRGNIRGRRTGELGVDLQKSRDVREVSQKILKVCRDIRRPSNLGGRCRLKLNKRLSDISGYMSRTGLPSWPFPSTVLSFVSRTCGRTRELECDGSRPGLCGVAIAGNCQ
jgi:hypothetical protein